MKKLTELDRQEMISEDEEAKKLFEEINNLRAKLSDLFKKKYNRSLPFNELLFDRWARAGELGFGAGTSVYDSSLIIGNVSVGSNTWIGPNTLLDGSGNLKIGNNCSISANVQLYSHDSVQWALSGGAAPYEYAETAVGDNCYIGPNTVISKGVILGDGTVVGANSFVNKSFPAQSKIAGNPAKLLTNE